jgi:hypothetical protein
LPEFATVIPNGSTWIAPIGHSSDQSLVQIRQQPGNELESWKDRISLLGFFGSATTAALGAKAAPGGKSCNSL